MSTDSVTSFTVPASMGTSRDYLDDGPGSSSGLLGPPPSLPVDAAAMRARQAIKASLFPEQAALAPQIGRFVVLRELGRGGMGVVYVAYDETLDRRVALKLLYELPGDAGGQARLLREAQTMARLNHPNIAAVYEAGTHEDRVYVAMEFVQGQPIDVWLREKPRPWREVVDVFVQAGRGLHAAHCAGLVHRDFKPANVMLGRDGRVRVLDFGLARGTPALTSDTTLGPLATTSVTLPIMPPGGPLTREGMIVGTPAYMPPEQFCGQPIDPRTDQYALCVSMYEGLYGRLPFYGETLTELWAAVLDGPPKAPPRGPRVPGWLHRLLLRGLDPDQARRFPSMTALLAALQRRPRGQLWGTLFVLCTVLSAAVIYGVASERQAQCTFGEADLVGIWDGPRKDWLRAALLRDGSARSYEVMQNAERLLDAHAQRWLDDQRSSCRTYQDGKESADMYDKRRQCYVRAGSMLASTVEVLSTRTRLDSERTIEALDDLPSCTADLVALWAADLPDGDKLEVVNQLYGKFYDLKNTYVKTIDAEDLDAVETLSSMAKDVGYLPLMADVMQLRAEFEHEFGLSRESCASARESYLLAETAGKDVQAAFAAHAIVDVCRGEAGAERVDPDMWARIALAKLAHAERLGGTTHLLLLSQLAETMIERNEPENAAGLLLDGLLTAEALNAVTSRYAVDALYAAVEHYVERFESEEDLRMIGNSLAAIREKMCGAEAAPFSAIEDRSARTLLRGPQISNSPLLEIINVVSWRARSLWYIDSRPYYCRYKSDDRLGAPSRGDGEREPWRR